MDIKLIYKLYSENYLVDTDSRAIRNGSVFFALRGDNFNGNSYAIGALESGASYAIVDEYISNDNRLIIVDDVLVTLQELAKYHRSLLNIPVLALTGSNGKTTTKELIKVVLEKKYKTRATFGNLNNHIGVPLTILSIEKNIEFAIVEMGANHPKEIEFLSSIVMPDYGYITNFGKAHLEGFGSLNGVIEAKSELYENIIRNDKIIFVNPQDNEQMERTSIANRVLLKDDITMIESAPFLILDYANSKVNTNLVGDYNVSNINAAITIGEYFEVSKNDIIDAVISYAPTNNRSQIIKTCNNEIVLDAYNANPTSIKAAVNSFLNFKSVKKALVLGDMFELGEDSLLEHQLIVEAIAKEKFDAVFLIGEIFSNTNCDFVKFKTFDEFSEYFEKLEFIDYKFLIKGSRGMKLERVVDLID